MARVAVTIIAARNPPGHKHAVVKCAGKRVEMPITSPTAEHSTLSGDWKQVPRPLEKPLIGMAGKLLETAKLTCTLARPDGQSVEPRIHDLKAFARDPDHHVTVANYGTLAAGPWHITDLTITSDRRRFGTNHVTRAQVTLTLTEAVPDPNPKATKKKNGNGSGKRPKTYVVRKGDTLPSIARKFYGHADAWHQIARANHIRNPHSIHPGQKLRLP